MSTSMSVRVITAIVRKDFHSLLPLILLAWVMFVAQPVMAGMNLEHAGHIWLLLQRAFFGLGYFLALLLMISALQLEPAASLDHDWLTRPIPRLHWLLAKLLFLFLAICVPIVLPRFAVNLWNDHGVIRSLVYATSIDFPPALPAVPILFAIALLTPTLRRAIVVIVLLCMTFMIPAWDVTRPLVDHVTDFGSMMWLQILPLLAVGIASAPLVYWLLYCRRRQRQANLAFGIGFVLVFFLIFPPASIYGWDEVIAVHKWMINEPDDSLDDAVILEHTLACFPAAPIEGDPTTEAAHPVLVQANWDNRIIERAGPGALTFATTVRSRDTLVEWISPSNTTRDISVDWRIDRIRVRGRITADSVPGGVELIRSDSAANRASSMSSVQTDYWLAPGEAVHTLAGDPTARLTLDYDLALLSPTPYELKTDGVSREFPLLGTCRAEIDDNANAIEIECMKQGARPALVSAKLVGVTGSRVDSYSRPSYAPDWLESIGRGRYELTLRSPNLVDSSAIIVTAYEVERILHKQLESPGILGGPPSICPTPGSEQYAAVEGSSWSDKSPHEVSFVSVDRGVRVEVLDWRTDAHTDKPVLFLIPGLGATAHSYDDVAPKLAEKYAVVGMTRRGIGASSKPDYGYDVARLSQDVIRVLDTLGIESAILVGVSIAGSELSFLGANYPQRFAGLIYLDSAYDQSTTIAIAPQVLLPQRPPPRPSDLVSYDAIKQYMQRTEGRARTMPEGEIMAMYDFDSWGVKHDLRYLDAIEMGLEAPDYERIPLPALAIYAMPTSPEYFIESWYDRDDPVIQRVAAAMFEWTRRIKTEQVARFSAGVHNSEVLILEDAEHVVLISNEEEVLAAIDGFVERIALH